MSVNTEVDQLAEVIWNYHLLHHDLKKSDCILALGSNDIRVAEHAVKLFHEGWAPLLIFSGKSGELTKGLFDCPEAEYFSKIAVKMGVPRSKILIEANSTNTGENIQFTRNLLSEKGINPNSLILVQKPFMERRTYATFKKHWPEKDIILSTQNISFSQYPNHFLSKEHVINVMVGDLQRIKEYPSKGFQIPQTIPERVWEAYKDLVELGYDHHLIK